MDIPFGTSRAKMRGYPLRRQPVGCRVDLVALRRRGQERVRVPALPFVLWGAASTARLRSTLRRRRRQRESCGSVRLGTFELCTSSFARLANVASASGVVSGPIRARLVRSACLRGYAGCGGALLITPTTTRASAAP